MWDIRKKGCIFGYKGHNSTVNSLKFSPDGQWIASGGEDNFVKVSLKLVIRETNVLRHCDCSRFNRKTSFKRVISRKVLIFAKVLCKYIGM